MTDLRKYYMDNQTGISYTLVGDYYLPNIKAPEINIGAIGRYGPERLTYLKNHRRIMYINLLTSGKLNEHLYEIDESANNRIEYLVRRLADCEGVTEKLKAKNMMLWVQLMNSIKNRAIEITRDELIYA